MKRTGSTRWAQLAHQVLSMALKDAMIEGHIGRNPCDAVGKPGHAAAERSAFTASVAKHIIATAVASRDDMWATRWAAAFLTGARRSELLGLTWDRVDLDDGFIELAWQLQRLTKEHGCGLKKPPPTDLTGEVAAPRAGAGSAYTGHRSGSALNSTSYPCGRTRPSWCPQARWNLAPGFEMRECHGTLCWTRPKTKAGTRVVPLLPPMITALEQLKNLDGDNPHNLVWHHPNGRPISPEEDHTAWKTLLKAAGVPDAPLHAARHTTATLLMAAGVDESTRMAVMGQNSVAAHRGYLHVDQTQTRAALGNLNQLLG